MNKKLLVFILCLTTGITLANAQFNKKDALNMSLIGDFTTFTGEKTAVFNQYLDIAIQDPHWQKANDFFYNKTNKLVYPDYVPEDRRNNKARVPDWENALKYFKLSVIENKNVLSAYEGMTLLATYFTLFTPDANIAQDTVDNILTPYLPVFTQLLKEKGYCYGHMYDISYHIKYAKDAAAALKLNSSGLEVCKNQITNNKIPNWIEFGFRKDYSKAQTIVKNNIKLKGSTHE